MRNEELWALSAAIWAELPECERIRLRYDARDDMLCIRVWLRSQQRQELARIVYGATPGMRAHPGVIVDHLRRTLRDMERGICIG